METILESPRTKETVQLAKEKAAKLLPRQQIRLHGGDVKNSYWLYNIDGKCYIGSEASEPLKPLFKNIPVLEMIDNNTNQVYAKVQRLKM